MKDRTHNVEMCPESALEAREAIENRGLRVVGWYHTHPFFKAEPSEVDTFNH